MSFSYQGESISVYTQPIQWMDYERYKNDLALNHSMNLEMGYTGSLCYLNHNDFYDPWLLAAQLVQQTGLQPLVAVNPAYHHPYIIARSVFTLSEMRGGPIALNFIAGTATSDLQQIGELMQKEQRYERLGEMMQLVQNYLGSTEPWTFDGAHYQIEASSFLGSVQYLPEFFVAGHSAPAQKLAQRFKANWAKSLLPENINSGEGNETQALGFGVYLADTAEQAKKELSAILGIDRTSETLFRLKMANTDAQWKQEQAQSMWSGEISDCYFPQAIQSQANVPFLVGNKEEVAHIIHSRIFASGIRKLIVPMIGEKGYRDLAEVLQ